MEIIKRNGRKEEFNSDKIKNAIKAAFNSIGYSVDDDVYDEMVVKDPFNEESEITWKRMLLNKFAFYEQYN